jgi:protein required for attachment to host cells
VVPAHFHGVLDTHLSQAVKESIVKIIHKDWTALPTEDLATMLNKEF